MPQANARLCLNVTAPTQVVWENSGGNARYLAFRPCTNAGRPCKALVVRWEGSGQMSLSRIEHTL